MFLNFVLGWCVRVLRTRQSFNDSLGKHTWLNICHTCAWNLPWRKKKQKVKSAKRKVTWGRDWRKPGPGFQGSSQSGITKDIHKAPNNELWQHKWKHFQPGKYSQSIKYPTPLVPSERKMCDISHVFVQPV